MGRKPKALYTTLIGRLEERIYYLHKNRSMFLLIPGCISEDTWKIGKKPTVIEEESFY